MSTELADEEVESKPNAALANAGQEIVCDIPTDKLYRFYSSSGTFFVPLIVMTFVYVRIYTETKRRLRERARMAQKLAKSMAQSQQVTRVNSQLSANGSAAGASSTRYRDRFLCLSRLCSTLGQLRIKNTESRNGAKKS